MEIVVGVTVSRAGATETRPDPLLVSVLHCAVTSSHQMQLSRSMRALVSPTESLPKPGSAHACVAAARPHVGPRLTAAKEA